MKQHADDCLATIGVSPGQKVLDFGCANGNYAIPAAKIVGEQGGVYAMHNSAEALDTLRRRASAQGLTQIQTINIHGEVQVPLESESVDVVLLEHVGSWAGEKGNHRQTTANDETRIRRLLFQEMYRIMQWDGVLYVFSPHPATDMDGSSEDDLKCEIESFGFRLEKEMYRQLIHDNCVRQGHLYGFCKRHTTSLVLDRFLYDSLSFQIELEKDAHHHGEVIMLEAMAEPAMVVLELGANKGVTAIALARSVGPQGQVHAFEPVPEYYAALVGNLSLNEVDNVRVHQLAVIDKESEISFYKHGEGSGIVQADGAENIIVGTTSLDNFVEKQTLERVDLINMDCEGAELLALRGGKKTLQQNTPRIFCEIHHDYLSRLGQSVHDIVEYLHMLDFQVMPVSVEALDKDVKLEYCTHICAVTNGNLPDIKRLARLREKEQR
ncbi:MAG: FkbM family methyltransferase [Deltaproteobacteria bacterium]|nr:FkbM family methyltransferase [Deltaproteobacteria bacterium]